MDRMYRIKRISDLKFQVFNPVFSFGFLSCLSCPSMLIFLLPEAIDRRFVMRTNLVRGVGGAFVALLILVLCLPVAQSQQRRKRTSRRVTHPVRSQTAPS